MGDPKNVLNGFSCKNLKSEFPEYKSWKISNILARLRKLGVIVKRSKTYKYYFTQLGKQVLVATELLKNCILTPSLALG